ncbi:MAG TPA: hypothetical protein VFH38_13050 [Jatrophihabitans sp.]|nr:hypothetical protein [Jatrophihabitans sp.]
MSGLRVRIGCIGAVTALVAMSACTSGSATHAPPRGVTGCNHMFSIGDAGTGLGLDWDSDSHAYGDQVFVYVCDGAAEAVTVDAPPRASISPPSARVGTAALLQFRVLVERGAHGAFHFRFTDGSGGAFGDVRLPRIVAEKQSWHFAEA